MSINAVKFDLAMTQGGYTLSGQTWTNIFFSSNVQIRGLQRVPPLTQNMEVWVKMKSKNTERSRITNTNFL